MKNFSIWTAGYYAFFSRRFYEDVALRWRARAFVYLLLLLAVLWIPFMFTAVSGWNSFFRDEAPLLIQQIPPITIRNGSVTADVQQPYFMRDAENGTVFAIIDTTGEFTSLENTSARLLLTESQLFLSKSDAETRVYDLSAVQEFHFDDVKAERWLGLFGTWGLMVLYPMAVLGSYAYRIAQALFYTVFGLLILKLLGRSIGYAGLLRLAVVAATPAIVLKTVIQMLDATFAFSWALYFLVSMGYLAFGVSSISTPAEEHTEATLT